jgi:predicted N-formylglutamate amidohydrolase
MQSWIDITATTPSPILIIADHASAIVPPGLDLGIDRAVLETHIAVDIGVDALSRALCAELACRAILGGVSRLAIDLNREADAPGLIPVSSDGIDIPGNRIDDAERAQRIADYWYPYHTRIAAEIAAHRPRLIVSVHSFTPQLASDPDQARPWEIGILYNDDDRAARIAIPLLKTHGLCVGDQLPYSGKLLNATMNRHAEGNGIAYLGIEVRQDGLTDAASVSRWARLLAPVILACCRD